MAYYLLCNQLGDLLIKSKPSRIVNVASHYAGGLDLDDLNYDKRSYSNNAAYRQSKQADRMLTWYLAEKFQEKGVTANACHPGVIDTPLLSGLGYGPVPGQPSDGAKTPAWLATSKSVEGVTGKFWDLKQEKTCSFRDKMEVAQLWNKLASLESDKTD